MNNITSVEHLAEIAKKCLRACYLDGMIIASPEKYRDFWARDTFFALPGVVKIGDLDVAKNSILGFLKFQREDGKIPRKIVRNNNFLLYFFGKHRRLRSLRPVYRGIIPGFFSTDENALIVIASWNYLSQTKDIEFIRGLYKQLVFAVRWYRPKERTGLIHSYFLSDWMDTVFKFGPVLYSNVLYCHSLKCIGRIARELGHITEADHFDEEYERMRKKINIGFWNGKFFSNKYSKTGSRFDSAGNVLASYFNVAYEEKKWSVAKKIIEIHCESGLIPTLHPKYPFWKINPVASLLMFGDYHSDNSWLWIDLFAVRILDHAGQPRHAETLRNQIRNIVRRDNTIGEVYFCSGEVYKKLFWKSVAPFAWSSGVFLETEIG